MTKEDDFKLLKIQTCVLKVNIHCDGCKQKVKKLLQKIEGVYQVQVDAEQQKVTVSGSVDSATLIKKLARARKYAELWSQKTNQKQQKQNNNISNNNCVKNDKNQKVQKQGQVNKGLGAFNNQQKFKFPACSSEEDEFYEDDDEEDYDDGDGQRFISEKPNQLNLIKQQQPASAVKSAKKNDGPVNSAASNSGGKANNDNNANGGRKGGFDPKAMAALKMNSNANLGSESLSSGEPRRVTSDIGSMMSLAGFSGNLNNNANSSGFGGFQVQSNPGFQGPSSGTMPNDGLLTNQQYPSPSSSSFLMNMNGFNNNNHPSSLMMNMKQQQPQMMYQRAPFVPPSTGYYWNNSCNYNNNTYSPAIASYSHHQLPNYFGEDHCAADMFSDDNTNSSCSVM
ncbi:heavy metal-associated isoprenylated plant protein 37-like [Prosopis cineraria]|uniref:heavy metal-associated isoprenylated plant protein 37-like n=1 Tax=Prosopis cineraria TaxID=364024 RepID=UPI00240FBF46|nr:heavy metal-associated isoprenylated plant protein 37-like [Prosopis cineraria]XP_054776041.1 heavy metal-associated isoprenylated plant protein 37-like [Prosopis cineraria]